MLCQVAGSKWVVTLTNSSSASSFVYVGYKKALGSDEDDAHNMWRLLAGAYGNTLPILSRSHRRTILDTGAHTVQRKLVSPGATVR